MKDERTNARYHLGLTVTEALQFKGITIVCSPTGCGCYDNDAGVRFKC